MSINALIGKKLGMTQIYSDDGSVQPVTVIEAGPCKVVQVKTEENDGYKAAQLGFGVAKKLKSPQKGQVKDLGLLRYLREIRVDDTAELNRGDVVDVSIFQVGDKVDVIGVSKGKGFAGTIKRHGFSGGPKTHGQSDRWRAPGSIGASASPGRVWKGTRMAGHMGSDRVTVRKLEVFVADAEKNILFVKGAIPGAKNSIVIVRKSIGGK